jgi:3-oxoacyl-[acyl-carrier protein] reductase
MDKPLLGQVAFVTGGSRGIGAAIVKRLATDGAAVAFTYNASQPAADQLAEQLNAAGGQVRAMKVDNADSAAVKAAIDQAARPSGKLDILVNNAGIFIMGDVAAVTEEQYDTMFAVNVRSSFFAIQAALAHMAAGARIVTIGSGTADRSGFPQASVYAMTKAALAAMSRGLARDLGPRGITINTVQPGPIETDMTDRPDARAIVRPMTCLKRMGQAEEVADSVSFLVSQNATFITGAALDIDGGYNV